MAAIRTRNRKHKNKDRTQTTQKRGEYREEENGWFTAACRTSLGEMRTQVDEKRDAEPAVK